MKMLHQHGGNLLFSLANTPNVRKALLNLEFISVADQFMSSLAEMADVVLPVAHWLEEEDIWDEHAGFYVSAVNRVVSPPGEAWPTARIYYEIGKRIAPAFWPWETPEGMLDYQLRRAGISWKEFSKVGCLATKGKDQKYYKYKTDFWVKGGGFPTPTRKVELYSTVLEKLGYDPLPDYIEPNESYYSTPEVAKEYPLILSTGGRIPFYFHTQYANIPWLRETPALPARADPSGDRRGARDRGGRLGLDRIAARQDQAEGKPLCRNGPPPGGRPGRLLLLGETRGGKASDEQRKRPHAGRRTVRWSGGLHKHEGPPVQDLQSGGEG